MKPQELINKVEQFRVVVDTNIPNLRFTCKVLEPPDVFSKWWNKGWPTHMPDRESGIYIFSNLNDDILYIGKATTDDLGKEIWSKFNKPSIESQQFSQSPFMSEKDYPNVEKGHRDAIHQGNIILKIAVIRPKEMSSLIEVFLQTTFFIATGYLPPFNRQIG